MARGKTHELLLRLNMHIKGRSRAGQKFAITANRWVDFDKWLNLKKSVVKLRYVILNYH